MLRVSRQQRPELRPIGHDADHQSQLMCIRDEFRDVGMQGRLAAHKGELLTACPPQAAEKLAGVAQSQLAVHVAKGREAEPALQVTSLDEVKIHRHGRYGKCVCAAPAATSFTLLIRRAKRPDSVYRAAGRWTNPHCSAWRPLPGSPHGSGHSGLTADCGCRARVDRLDCWGFLHSNAGRWLMGLYFST